MSNSKVKMEWLFMFRCRREMGRRGSRPHKVMVPSFYILSLGPWMAQGVKIMCCKSCLLRGRLLLHCNCNMRDTDKA